MLCICAHLKLRFTGFKLESSCKYVLRACMILVIFFLRFYIKPSYKCCLLWGTLFNLFLPSICFSVFALEPSKNLSLKLASLAQSLKGTVPPQKKSKFWRKKNLLLMKYEQVTDIVVELYRYATYVEGF